MPQSQTIEIYDHGHGYAADRARYNQLNRRRAIGLLGMASTAALLSACGGEGSTGSTSTSSSGSTPTPTPTATPTPTSSGGSASCVALPAETNGPYPADGTNTSSGYTSNVVTNSAFQRADIRTSANTGNTADGVQLTLSITLADVNNSCAALQGYAIYIWHCTADGKYSLYTVPAEDYLRGIQTTDSNGQVTFTTIVPGCYSGRYPHIHFEVYSSIANATNARSAVLISQFAVPKDLLAAMYAADSRYTASVANLNSVSLSNDNVFGDNTDAENQAMTLEMSGSAAAGYTAAVTVGIAT